MKSKSFSARRGGAATVVPALLAAGGLLTGALACRPAVGHAGWPRGSGSSGSSSVTRPRPPKRAFGRGFPGDTTSAWWGAPVVADDFTEPRLDPRKWVVYNSPGAKINPRTSAATRLSHGRLQMTGGIYHGRDLSGGVASTRLQRFGRWEVRLRAERGAGYSAVALLWPQHMGKPEFAEIDFAEIADPTRRSAAIFIHHGPRDDQVEHLLRADFTRWHVVAVDWLPDRLTFWLDGRRVWTYRGPLIPRRDKMGLALQNDQICDRGPAFCRNPRTPKWVTMRVDWVRIYRAPARRVRPVPS